MEIHRGGANRVYLIPLGARTGAPAHMDAHTHMCTRMIARTQTLTAAGSGIPHTRNKRFSHPNSFRID